jgi:hypothetical protein
MRADGLVLALALAIGAASPAVSAASPAPDRIPSDVAIAAEAQAANSAAAWNAYLAPVLEAMRTSVDVHEQALALSAMHRLQPDVASADAHGGADTSSEAIGAIARAHPDDVLLQRIAALEGRGPTRAAALARLQQLEPDNAANWALSLPGSRDKPTDPLPTLDRMAAAVRFDDGTAGDAAVWSRAFARFLPPQDVLASADPTDMPDNPTGLANMSAFGMAMATGIAWHDLLAACKPGPDTGTTAGVRRDRCVTVGRLLLHEATTLIAAHMGEAVLRRLDATDDRDAARIADLRAWRQAAMPADAGWNEAFLANWLVTGSEIEALRLGATGAGESAPSG